MKFATKLIAGDEFRCRVGLLGERLGPLRIEASASWQNLARQFDIGSGGIGEAAALIVGSPAEVLAHARTTTADFGFVMPVAQVTKWWQRAPSWRDDATLALWQAGWTPLTIDRLVVPTSDAIIEFVVGSARRTPRPVESNELRGRERPATSER